jgi:hypothetical protein
MCVLVLRLYPLGSEHPILFILVYHLRSDGNKPLPVSCFFSRLVESSKLLLQCKTSSNAISTGDPAVFGPTKYFGINQIIER